MALQGGTKVEMCYNIRNYCKCFLVDYQKDMEKWLENK